MRKFDRTVGLVSFCMCFGIGHAAEPSDIYADLYSVLHQKAAAPEKMGCFNRAPFGEGFACDSNEPGASFQYHALFVDSVSQTYRNEVVTTTLSFSPDHCIAYDGFEAHLLKSSDGKLVKFWRSDHWYRPDGSGSGERDDYRFYEAKKLSVFHRIKTDTSCITEIQMTKRIRSKD
jgi:hypothetical protein